MQQNKNYRFDFSITIPTSNNSICILCKQIILTKNMNKHLSQHKELISFIQTSKDKSIHNIINIMKTNAFHLSQHILSQNDIHQQSSKQKTINTMPPTNSIYLQNENNINSNQHIINRQQTNNDYPSISISSEENTFIPMSQQSQSDETETGSHFHQQSDNIFDSLPTLPNHQNTIIPMSQQTQNNEVTTDPQYHQQIQNNSFPFPTISQQQNNIPFNQYQDNIQTSTISQQMNCQSQTFSSKQQLIFTKAFNPQNQTSNELQSPSTTECNQIKISETQLTEITEEIKLIITKIVVDYFLPFSNGKIFGDFLNSFEEILSKHFDTSIIKMITKKLGKIDQIIITKRIKEIGNKLKNHNLNRIKNSLGYSIQFDESNDNSNQSQTVIHSRVLEYIDGKETVSNVFVGLVENPENHIDAHSILKSIEKRIGPIESNVQKLRAITTDGPHSMLLLRSIIKSIYTLNNSLLIDNTCALHIENNIAKEILFEEVTLCMNKFLQFINGSPKRSREFGLKLKDVVNYQTIPKYKEIRWLSTDITLSRMIETYDISLEYINGIVIEFVGDKVFCFEDLKKYDEKVYDVLKKLENRKAKQKGRKTRKNWNVVQQKVSKNNERIIKYKTEMKENNEKDFVEKQLKKYGDFPHFYRIMEHNEFRKDFYFDGDIVHLFAEMSRIGQNQSINVQFFIGIIGYLCMSLEDIRESFKSNKWMENEHLKNLQLLKEIKINLGEKDKERYREKVSKLIDMLKEKYRHLDLFDRMETMINIGRYKESDVDEIINEFVVINDSDEIVEAKTLKRKGYNDIETLEMINNIDLIKKQMKNKLINELEVLKDLHGEKKEERRSSIINNPNQFQHCFEILVSLAVIFPTSVHSESTFSVMNSIKTSTRSKMRNDLLESMLFIKYSQMEEFFNASKEYLEEHKELRSYEHRQNVAKK